MWNHEAEDLQLKLLHLIVPQWLLNTCMTWYDTGDMCGMKKYFICEAGMGQRPQTSAEHLASQRSNEAAAEAESVDYVEACHNSTIIYLCLPSHCESAWGLRARRHEYSPGKLLTCEAASLQTVQLQEDPTDERSV